VINNTPRLLPSSFDCINKSQERSSSDARTRGASWCRVCVPSPRYKQDDGIRTRIS
jgi:hypothetical protein